MPQRCFKAAQNFYICRQNSPYAFASIGQKAECTAR